MEKLICYTLGAIIGIALVLGIYWLVWQGYMLLIAYWCVKCSATVLQPNYWYFSGTLLALAWIARFFRGKKS